MWSSNFGAMNSRDDFGPWKVPCSVVKCGTSQHHPTQLHVSRVVAPPWCLFSYLLVLLVSCGCRGFHCKGASISNRLSWINMWRATGLASEPGFHAHWGAFVLEILVDYNNWPCDLLVFLLFLPFKFPLFGCKFTIKEWTQGTTTPPAFHPNTSRTQVHALYLYPWPCDLAVWSQVCCVIPGACKESTCIFPVSGWLLLKKVLQS